MKVKFLQDWSYRGENKTVFMIDYKKGVKTVPRDIARAAVDAGVAEFVVEKDDGETDAVHSQE